jgi:hypothetical protein
VVLELLIFLRIQFFLKVESDGEKSKVSHHTSAAHFIKNISLPVIKSSGNYIRHPFQLSPSNLNCSIPVTKSDKENSKGENFLSANHTILEIIQIAQPK